MRRLRRLVQKKALRWSEGVCVLEGPDLVDAALRAQVEFEGLYLDVERSDTHTLALAERAESQGVRVFALSPGVLEKISDAQSPQPVIAAVRFVPRTLMDISLHGCVLIAHDVRDPGNVGTMIRTADAAGATAVILSGHSVDPYNPKTLRATAGSIFHVPVVLHHDLAEVLEACHRSGRRSFAAVVRGGVDHYRAPLGGDVALVLGNESEGLDDAEISLCTDTVSISMVGANESLNVAVAASLLVFEAFHQRGSGQPASTT